MKKFVVLQIINDQLTTDVICDNEGLRFALPLDKEEREYWGEDQYIEERTKEIWRNPDFRKQGFSYTDAQTEAREEFEHAERWAAWRVAEEPRLEKFTER